MEQMTLHLLKDPINPLALQLLSAQPSTQAAAPVVVLLSSTDTPPALSKCTVYHVAEKSNTQKNNCISYDRLVAMVFEADRVITW